MYVVYYSKCPVSSTQDKKKKKLLDRNPSQDKCRFYTLHPPKGLKISLSCVTVHTAVPCFCPLINFDFAGRLLQ